MNLTPLPEILGVWEPSFSPAYMATHHRAPYFHVSSFTDVGLQGNAAGVVLLDASCPPLSDEALRRAAGELGHSETAFVLPQPPGTPPAAATDFALRWFSPGKEVPLCGHGTLAAAHALVTLGNPHPVLTFHTLSGALRVRTGGATACSASAAATSTATLDFPANSPTPRDAAEAPVAELARLVLGAEHAHLLQSCHYSARARKAVLVLAPGSEAALAALRPSGAALLALRQDPSAPRIEGVSAACAPSAPPGAAAAPPSFFCRYWSPWNGLPGESGEDPVNGSSHTLLAPLFGRLLGVGEGEEMASTHLSARGGRLHVAVLPGGERVSLRGQASTVCEGALWLAL